MAGPRSLAKGVAQLARDLAGQSSADLIELLDGQLSCTERGAHLVMSLARGSLPTAAAHEAMREVEHQGDSSRSQLVAALARILATPIDAEDLFRLSRSIDDVLDNLRDFVREVDLYRVDDLDFALPIGQAVAEGIESLRAALRQLDNPRGRTGEATVSTRKAASRVRRIYEQQLAELLNRELTNETLKRRELLRRLDVVGLRLGEAADALADGALKRNR